ncbi:DUF5672 family protein [Hymenobacter sp.]|jgi:hypothetical protein|uniref:DUF5672 family protein n=1 Tax=Hymenobacter sp. TaxID=1898978 RepID=UPI002ED78974
MKQDIAIIIPIYKQYSQLNTSELKSLHNTYKVLGAYDIVFVTHQNIGSTAYFHGTSEDMSFKVEVFPYEYFSGLASYSDLLLSLEFYKRFAGYKYIVICQLDVFVFADQLHYFIEKGYDYIGAPWFEGFDQATHESSITGVGNGGFSLRKVKSFLDVLYALELFRNRRPTLQILQAVTKHWLNVLRVAKHEFHRRRQAYDPALPWQTPMYEDGYWGIMVPVFFPWFKVGTVEDAIAFAFEVNPSLLYALNHNKLPMATHAWEKYDPDFWKPFI